MKGWWLLFPPQFPTSLLSKKPDPGISVQILASALCHLWEKRWCQLPVFVEVVYESVRSPIWNLKQYLRRFSIYLYAWKGWHTHNLEVSVIVHGFSSRSCCLLCPDEFWTLFWTLFLKIILLCVHIGFASSPPARRCWQNEEEGLGHFGPWQPCCAEALERWRNLSNLILVQVRTAVRWSWREPLPGEFCLGLEWIFLSQKTCSSPPNAYARKDCPSSGPFHRIYRPHKRSPDVVKGADTTGSLAVLCSNWYSWCLKNQNPYLLANNQKRANTRKDLFSVRSVSKTRHTILYKRAKQIWVCNKQGWWERSASWASSGPCPPPALTVFFEQLPRELPRAYLHCAAREPRASQRNGATQESSAHLCPNVLWIYVYVFFWPVSPEESSAHLECTYTSPTDPMSTDVADPSLR